MPYFSDEDLPESIQKNLPTKAKKIYRKAFNHAWDAFRNPALLKKGEIRVEVAAKIAWSAVKQEYIKRKNKWVKKHKAYDLGQEEYIDISWSLKPGITEFDRRKILEFESFGQETILTMVNHTGTHVDGPKYFFQKAKSIDTFDLCKLMGICRVVDVTHLKTGITKCTVKSLVINAGEIILFKTKNSYLAEDALFTSRFIYLEQSAAEYLVEKKVKAIGIDYVALEITERFPSHKILLAQNILIIEGLRLEKAKQGVYQLIVS